MKRTILLILASSLGGAVVMAQDSMQQAALGAKVFAETCNRCHEPPDPSAHDSRAWRAISLHMRQYADISKDEQEKVLAYLRTFNAPKKP